MILSPNRELVQNLATLSYARRKRILSDLTKEELNSLIYDWGAWAREDQMAPDGDWLVWLLLGGRGSGKTRSGAEETRRRAESGRYPRIHLIAATAGDARDIIIEGESGLLSVCPPWAMPKYEPTKRRLTWPNGTQALIFSAEESDRLRGPQCHFLWADEVASWPDLDDEENTWSMAMFGLRLSTGPEYPPQAVITTTPRAIKLIKNMVEESKLPDSSIIVRTSTTYDNKANLADSFFRHVVSQYEGTRIGRQELLAKILEDDERALFNRAMLDKSRVKQAPLDFIRVVVAIDPSVNATGAGDECGIVVAGLAECSCRGRLEPHGFILQDASLKASPDTWAERAVSMYDAYMADVVVGETNQGGALVESTLRTKRRTISYKPVHAKRGKDLRAQPVAALFEQGRVHIVGSFEELEDQMCLWVPGDKSPDRLDAMVYAISELLVKDSYGDDIIEHIKRKAKELKERDKQECKVSPEVQPMIGDALNAESQPLP